MAKIVVLFEVSVKPEGLKPYLDQAAHLKTFLQSFSGFISAERFTSLVNEGKLLSMSVWDSENVLEQWRNLSEHRWAQKMGRNDLFIDYKITVASVIREYSSKDRDQAPVDSNEHFKV